MYAILDNRDDKLYTFAKWSEFANKIKVVDYMRFVKQNDYKDYDYKELLKKAGIKKRKLIQVDAMLQKLYSVPNVVFSDIISSYPFLSILINNNKKEVISEKEMLRLNNFIVDNSFIELNISISATPKCGGCEIFFNAKVSYPDEKYGNRQLTRLQRYQNIDNILSAI